MAKITGRTILETDGWVSLGSVTTGVQCKGIRGLEVTRGTGGTVDSTFESFILERLDTYTYIPDASDELFVKSVSGECRIAIEQ